MGRVKVAVGIISFNSMPFLVGAITTMYPYAAQILVVDGPARFWQDRGYDASTDGTLRAFREHGWDHDKKIALIRGQWVEKDQQSNAYMPYIQEDITHVWVVDPDELYHAKDIELVLELLERYDVVRFRSYDFVGGFDRCVSQTNARQRILRYYPGARWETSRPPTILDLPTGKPWPETGRVLAGKVLPVRMYHYSHVFGHQREARDAYYGYASTPRKDIVPFTGMHPQWIEANRDALERVYGHTT